MKPNTQSLTCPLCHSKTPADFSQDKRRDYYQCNICNLVFVPPSQFLSAEDEKKRYDLHQNSPDDMGYSAFLKRLFVPLQNCLAPKSIGLDFGSGPAPTLSLMFEQAGHSMTLFDYFYHSDVTALNKSYDFITATEVLEHLHDPKKELDRLWTCLKQGGHLGIITKCAVSQDAFSTWHYKNDLTHVCFFSRSTFTWLARKWDAELTFPDEGVMIFSKKEGS